MNVQRPDVLLVANSLSAEYETTIDWLGQHSCLRMVTLERARNGLSSGVFHPDIMVVVQSRPGEVSQSEIEQLRSLAPLSCLAGILGGWCEGEMRSGRPWSGVCRYYWHQWPARFASQWERLTKGECPDWCVPLTFSNDERLLNMSQQSIQKGKAHIAVVARHQVTIDGITGMCAALGYSTVAILPHAERKETTADAVLWDVDCHSTNASDIFGKLSNDWRRSPIVALVNYPRHGETERWLQSGAAAVMSKPLMLDELQWQLKRVLATRESAFPWAVA